MSMVLKHLCQMSHFLKFDDLSKAMLIISLKIIYTLLFQQIADKHQLSGNIGLSEGLGIVWE